MTHLDRPLLIHVAAASEQRGRVVLASRSASPNASAMAAAFAVAAAFDTRVDCVLIECPDVLTLATHDFARSVSYRGRIAPLSDTAVRTAQAAATASARRSVTRAARAQGAVVVTSVVRDSLVDALARACAVEGPWNIVALAEPVEPNEGLSLQRILDAVSGATGIVCVGTQARDACADGPVILLVEDMDRLPQMLRAADRLAQATGAARARAVSLLVAGHTRDAAAEIEGHLRLLLSQLPTHSAAAVTLADNRILHGTAAEFAEAVRKQNGSFVIARSNGCAMPIDDSAAPMLATIRCPLLLVR